MVKPDKWVAVLFFVLISCEEQFVPNGMYGYQVENLLCDNGSSEWFDLTRSSNCGNFPNKLVFTRLSDSIVVSELIPTCDIELYDTLALGKANASENKLIFTDSLIFEDNSYWLIKKIRSSSLQLDISGSIIDYSR